MASSQGTSEKQGFTYNCERCSLVFIHKNVLRNHLACLHLDPYVYKCVQCKFFNQSGHKVRVHMHTEHGADKDVRVVNNDILCELCSLHFPTRSKLERHVRQSHSAELQCPACEEDQHFLTKETLKSHFISEHGESLWGSYVRTTYKEAYHRVHKLKVDPHTGEYCCYICNRNSYANRLVLFRHVTAHLNLYPYCCPDCPYVNEVRAKTRQHHARMHPNSSSKQKIVNRFARWDQELGITSRKKNWLQDTFTQESTGFEEEGLSELNVARKGKKVSVPSKPMKRLATICAKPLDENNFSGQRGEESVEKRNTYKSCFVCNFCDCSFASKPKLQQHISSHLTFLNKGALDKFKNSSEHASVENLANWEPSKAKNNELDFSEIQDNEVNSMALKTMEVLPGNDTKRAKETRTEHNDKKTPPDTALAYFCCICDSPFTSYIEFYTHTLKHENRAAYRCSSCSHTTIGLIQIRRHVKLKHSTQGKLSIQLVPVDLSCKTCEDLRANKKELQIHISRAHDVRLHCPLCQKLFENIPLLREHLELDHSTELWASHVYTVGEELREKVQYLKPDTSNEFTCFYCDCAYGERSGLILHLRYVHLMWRPGIFPRNFQQETGCRKRKGKKIRGKFPCYLCKSRFCMKGKLMKHLRTHSAIKNISLPYFCKSCGEFCAHRNSVEVHWYENHGKSEVRFTRISKFVYFRVNSLSNFPCRYCNIYRRTEADRQKHESEHHADNYKCSGCNFTCEKMEIMKIHITVVHAKSDPKPSMLRRKLCPVSTINKGADTQIASQSSVKQEAFPTTSLLPSHDIRSRSIKMEPDNSKLLNFEFVGCEPISKKPRTTKDTLKLPQSIRGFGLKDPATLVRKDQNVSLRKSPGFNAQLTGSKSPARAQGVRTYPSAETNPRMAKSLCAASSSEAQSNGKKSSSRSVVEKSTPLVVEINMNDSTATTTYSPGQGSVSHPQRAKIMKRILSSPMADTKSSQPKVKEERTSIITIASQTKTPASSYDSVIHSEGDMLSLTSSSDLQLRIGMGNNQTKTVPVSSIIEASLKCEDIHNTTNQFFNIKEEMEFEDSVIKEEPLDIEDSLSTKDFITYPITPFQNQALPSLTEVKSVKTENPDLQEEHAQSEVLPETTELSCVNGRTNSAPSLPARGDWKRRNRLGPRAQSCGQMSLDGSRVGEINESPASKIMDWNISQCSSFTDGNGAKVKTLPIPGISYTRRVISSPYPDSLPPVPGGCLPCSVQL